MGRSEGRNHECGPLPVAPHGSPTSARSTSYTSPMGNKSQGGAAVRALWGVQSLQGPQLRGVVRQVVDPVGRSRYGSVHRAASDAGVALTLDDGPDPRDTPRIVDILGGSSTTATFFLLAERAQRHPDLVGRVKAEGHEIALHGWDHRRVSGLSRLEAGTLRAERGHMGASDPLGLEPMSLRDLAREAPLEQTFWFRP